MKVQDYFLNYHAIVQHGNRESTLTSKPNLPFGKQLSRDDTSHMKLFTKFLKAKQQEKEAKMEKDAIAFAMK